MPSEEQTVESIVARVRGALAEAKLAQLDEIAQRLLDAEYDVSELLKSIRQRSTASFYVSATRLKKSATIQLSVRVSGVECGQVLLSARRGERVFTPTYADRHFRGCWTEQRRNLPWQHEAVRSYLAAAAAKVFDGTLAERESGVEAALLRELRGRKLPYNRPVLFPRVSGLPYQFPVPITAREGRIRSAGRTQAGHIDVLVRHGKGRSSRLRVLEVKRPNASDAAHALEQAVAYASALEVLLQRSSAYRELLGYPQYVPKLEATAVVADSEVMRTAIATAAERLGSRRGGFDVKLSSWFYVWDGFGAERTLRIVHEQQFAVRTS